MFTCSVRLWRWHEEASGKSKKLAKRRAACKMMHKITTEKLTIPTEELEQMDEAHIPIASCTCELLRVCWIHVVCVLQVERNDTQQASEVHMEPLSVKASKEINHFSKGLKSRGGQQYV